MIADYNGKAAPPIYNPSNLVSNSVNKSGSKISTDYAGFAIPPVNTSQFSSVLGGLSNSANSIQQSLGSDINISSVNIVPVSSGENPDKEPDDKNDKRDAASKEDGLLASLMKLLLGIISLGKKFGIAFQAIGNAAMGITMSTEGLIKIGMISIFHFANIFKVSVDVVIANITLITDFVVKLPKCFLVHILKMVFGVVYLIFPLFSYICWSLTGTTLMPAFESAFKMLDDGDNMISEQFFDNQFYLLKFPPSITNHCYYCNGKPYRLDDVLDDMNKIGGAGSKYNRDLERKAYPAMKPAKPYLLRTKKLVDKLMK
jgi:hypothetical protein